MLLTVSVHPVYVIDSFSTSCICYRQHQYILFMLSIVYLSSQKYWYILIVIYVTVSVHLVYVIIIIIISTSYIFYQQNQ